ncbi:hypothetical protein [Longispora urticae]
MADPTPTELAAQYGYAASFFQSIPELNNLLNQALAQKWTPARFQGEFMKSAWYRTTSDAKRQWNVLQTTDPATAERRLQDQTLKIRNMATQAGVIITDDRLRQMALETLSGGYSEEVLKNAVAAEFHYQPGGTTGGAASTEADMKRLAGDYGVTLSDQDVGSMVQGVMSGRFNQDNLLDFVRDQARSKYPGMTEWIDQGLSVRQVASPYTSSYSKLLEVDAASVDLNDPMIQKALQGNKNKDGQWAKQSLYDFENSIRQTPQWLKTGNAKEEAQTATNAVLRDWGLVT